MNESKFSAEEERIIYVNCRRQNAERINKPDVHKRIPEKLGHNNKRNGQSKEDSER